MLSFIRRISATVAVGALMTSTVAQAADLKYAIGYAPGSVPVLAAQEFAKFAKTNGSPNINVFPMSLLNIKETPPGVRDGVVDMGFNAHGIFQAEYPNSNLPAEFGMLATNATPPSENFWASAAMAGAITEYIMLRCPECIKEFDKEKQVYLSGQSSPPYALHCTKKVRTLAELKGKQIRTPSGYWARWVSGMGGVSVFMSANEAFTALSQGVVDCVVISYADLLNLRLIDIIKTSTIGVPQGVYSAASVATINTKSWRALGAPQRKALLESSAYLNAQMTFMYAKQAGEGLAAVKQKGIPVYDAAPDLKAATDKFIKDVRVDIAKEYTEKYRVANVDANINTVVGLIDKWVRLTKDARSADDLFKIYKSEIYSKIDSATYGM